MCIIWLKKLLGKTEEKDGTDKTMFLIIGLGNPGTKYAGTRHNIGWDVVTAISDATGIALKTKECKGITGTGVIDGVKARAGRREPDCSEENRSI